MIEYKIKESINFETFFKQIIKWLIKLTSIAIFIFFFLKISNVVTLSWLFIFSPILIFYVLAVFIPIGLYCCWVLTYAFYLKQSKKRIKRSHREADSFVREYENYTENEVQNMFKENKDG